MSDLQVRANQLRAAGRIPVYSIGYAIVDDPAKATHVQIQFGIQPSGKRLFKIDLDNHTAIQDADAARAAFTQALPQIAAKVTWRPSEGRKSRPGWHGYVESYKAIPCGPLYDQQGHHIGELLGKDSDRGLDPGDLPLRTLTQTEVEQLLSFWSVRSNDASGERWSDRVKTGKSWASGYTRIIVSRAQLRTFLTTHCGAVGRQLDARFDERTSFDRSSVSGSLMQNLMLWAHKLPCRPSASFTERCAYVMAYWMAADSYGKADEKTYNAERDGFSLIAQIVHEDQYLSGRTWTCPFWAKKQMHTPYQQVPTAPAAPAAQPIPHPAHRPKGDKEKHLATFRRVIEAIVPDDFGRRTFTLDYLTDRMQAAKCPAKPRTIQSYLKQLRDSGEIVTAQINGNGRPYAVLTSRFGGANKSDFRPKTPNQHAPRGDANESASAPIATPHSEEKALPCKEEHQDPSAPPPVPVRTEPAELLTLHDAVAQAFDSLQVDPATGEKRRVLTKRVLQLVLAHGPWSEKVITRKIADERERRRIAAMVFDIRQMPLNTLKAQTRLMEHLADKSRQQGTNLYKYAEWAAREMRAELASRPAPASRKARKNCEALPDIRQIAAEQQRTFEQQLLAEVDVQRRTPLGCAARADTPAGAQSLGVPPPAPAGAAEPPQTRYSAVGLVERLQTLKAAREPVTHG